MKAEERDRRMANKVVNALPPEQKARLKQEVLEKLIDKFRLSKDSEDAAHALSAAYLLFTVGNEYAERCIEIMSRYHLNRKKVKTTANNLMQSFEAFNKELATMVTRSEDLCNDTMLLSEIVDVFITKHIEVQRGPYFQPKLFLPSK